MFVAGRQPDQVTVAFGADASRALILSWRTASDVQNSVVRIHKTESDQTTAREVAGHRSRSRFPTCSTTPKYAGTPCAWRAWSPGRFTSIRWAMERRLACLAWKTIRTAPGPVSDACLMYVGDPQCGLEGWGKLLADAHKKRPDALAVLIAETWSIAATSGPTGTTSSFGPRACSSACP